MNTGNENAQLVQHAFVAAIGAFCLLFASAAMALEPLYDGFRSPVGIASDVHGTIYVTNWGGNTVERIAKDGKRSVFAEGIASPAGIAIDGAGNIFVSSYSGNYIMHYSPDGSGRRTVSGTMLPFPVSGTLTI